MAAKKTESIAAKLEKAAVLDRRSPLYLWMVEHFDALRDAIAKAGRPNWTSLAKTFAEEGVTDIRGKPPSPAVARLTWFKVRKAAEEKPTAKAAPSSPRTQSRSLATPSDTDQPEPRPKRKFAPSGPKTYPHQRMNDVDREENGQGGSQGVPVPVVPQRPAHARI